MPKTVLFKQPFFLAAWILYVGWFFFTNLIKLYFFKPVDPIVCPSFTTFNCCLPTERATSWGFFKSNVKNKHEEKTCSHHNKYNILKEENKKIQLWVKMEFRMCFCLVCYYCLLVCLFFQCTCTSWMIKSLLCTCTSYETDRSIRTTVCRQV